MKEPLRTRLNYLFSKIDWGRSHLDARAVEIMNTIGKEIEENEDKAMQYDSMIGDKLLEHKKKITEAMAEAHLKYGDYPEAIKAMSIVAEANNV